MGMVQCEKELGRFRNPLCTSDRGARAAIPASAAQVPIVVAWARVRVTMDALYQFSKKVQHLFIAQI